MIHRRDHRHHGLAVGKGQNRYLWAREELLDDHLIATLAKDLILHDDMDGGARLGKIVGNDHALAQCQTVGLDHDGVGGVVQILQSVGRLAEHLVSGGGNTVFLHQILGKDLTSLNNCGGLVGAKARNALFREGVNGTQHQRIVGGDYGVVDLVFYGKGHNGVNIGSRDRHTGGVGGHAAVAGQRVHALHGGILANGGNDGVLSAATAYNHNFHIISLLRQS